MAHPLTDQSLKNDFLARNAVLGYAETTQPTGLTENHHETTEICFSQHRNCFDN